MAKVIGKVGMQKINDVHIPRDYAGEEAFQAVLRRLVSKVGKVMTPERYAAAKNPLIGTIIRGVPMVTMEETVVPRPVPVITRHASKVRSAGAAEELRRGVYYHEGQYGWSGRGGRHRGGMVAYGVDGEGNVYKRRYAPSGVGEYGVEGGRWGLNVGSEAMVENPELFRRYMGSVDSGTRGEIEARLLGGSAERRRAVELWDMAGDIAPEGRMQDVYARMCVEEGLVGAVSVPGGGEVAVFHDGVPFRPELDPVTNFGIYETLLPVPQDSAYLPFAVR